MAAGTTAFAGVLAAGTTALEAGAAAFTGVLLKETGINFETGAAFFGVGRFAGGRAANGFTALALMMAVYVKSSTPITSPSDSSSVFREGELIFERWVT